MKAKAYMKKRADFSAGPSFALRKQADAMAGRRQHGESRKIAQQNRCSGNRNCCSGNRSCDSIESSNVAGA